MKIIACTIMKHVLCIKVSDIWFTYYHKIICFYLEPVSMNSSASDKGRIINMVCTSAIVCAHTFVNFLSLFLQLKNFLNYLK